MVLAQWVLMDPPTFDRNKQMTPMQGALADLNLFGRQLVRTDLTIQQLKGTAKQFRAIIERIRLLKLKEQGNPEWRI